MTESEREMIRRMLKDDDAGERFTSLQPSYEDSVAPSPEEDWEFEDR